MARPVHRDQARKFLAGLVALLVLGSVAFVGIRASTGGEIPAKSYTYVHVAFDDVGTLKTRQDVRRHSVRIGQVSAIDYRDGRAVVTLRLDGDRPVYRDATAKLWNESALGRQFVELDPGTPAAGALGDRVISSARTDDAISLSELTDIFRGAQPALASSLRELGGGLAGHSGDLQDAVRTAPFLLDDLGRISQAAAGSRANLPGLLRSANELVGRFRNRQAQLRALLEQGDSTLRAVNVDGAEPLGATLRGLPPTLREAQRALDAINQPLANVEAAVSTLQPGGQSLGASEPDLRGVLREAVVPLQRVPGVAEAANPAVEDLTRTLADARPLVPRVTRTLREGDALLDELAPYAPDAGQFFAFTCGAEGLLSGRFAPGKHYFQVNVAIPGGTEPALSLPDPTFQSEPYPEPGGGAYEKGIQQTPSCGGGDR